MKPNQIAIAGIGLAIVLCLPVSVVQAQPAPTEQPAAQGSSLVQRVQNRTYAFTNTGENLPYTVFVSSKVSKDKKSPLIVALRGAGGNPSVFMRGPALNLAEERGYILVGAMGYNSMGSFGMTSQGGVRRGMARMPSPTQGTNQPARGAQDAGRGAGRGSRSAGGTVETDAAKVSELSEKDVMNVLAMVRKEFNIDDQRIYLMGHSQGGAGALHIAGKFTSIWAAVAGLAPGAPGFQLETDANYKDVPMLIMVGQKDTLIASVQRLDEQLKSRNIAHEYKEMPGLDHGGIIMGAMPDVFKFFAEHTKPQQK